MSSSVGKNSIRSKIDSFFDNKGGSSSKKKQGQSHGHDLEDPVDIYSHTKMFFKKNPEGEDDEYSKQIEVGERKIKGDIELDDIVYSGKKISREQLMKQQQLQQSSNKKKNAVAQNSESEDEINGESEGDDEDEDIEIDEDDEDEIEDDDEYGEDEEAGESEAEEEQEEYSSEENEEEDQDDDDEEIDSDKVGEESEEEEDGDEMMQDDQESDGENEEGDQDYEIEKALKKLKEQESEQKEDLQQRISTEVEKAKSVKVQKKVFDQFLHQRILMQKLLSGANKIPEKEILQKFINQSQPVQHSILSLKRDMKKYIKDMTKLQKDLFTLSETKITISLFDENTDRVDKIYENLDKNWNQVYPFVEQTIDRWNSRTQLIKNISTNHDLTRNSKQFNKSIIEQVRSLMEDAQNKSKIVEKSKLKREHYKVFGRSIDDLTAERDQNIYNDFDFYQLLLKDYLASNDIATTADQTTHDDDIYVDGADLNLTQKFLEKRRKLQEAGQTKTKKEVDRKASKNRKIRYIVHEKLVNFMAGQDNLALMEGKDSILQSLFGQRVVYNTQDADESKKGQKKQNKKRRASEMDDEDDIRII